MLWVAFALCTGLIFYSGSKLSLYGDMMAEHTGLGRTWVGFVVLAAVTSMPELVTGLSSVTYAGVPDIAVGSILGSSVFNLSLLVLLDVLGRKRSVYSYGGPGHMTSALFGMLLLVVAAAGLVVGGALPALGWAGLYSFIFMLIYLVAVRKVYLIETQGPVQEAPDVEPTYGEADGVFLKFGLNAAVVIASAIFLPFIGEGLAESTGLGQTFVGNFFIAISTSLPELVVSIAAVRLGAMDMAIGNLLGSNIFNILILAIDDVVYTAGPLLGAVEPSHAVPAVSAILMSLVTYHGLKTRAAKRPGMPLAWPSAAILALFAANAVLLFALR